MKQNIRFSTFETNSSSVHSIAMLSEDEFASFKVGELYFHNYNQNFITREEIEKLSDFKTEYPNYDSYRQEEKDKAYQEFIDNNTCCDYPLLSSYYGTDIEYLDAYNEKGEKVKVLSIYIPG